MPESKRNLILLRAYYMALGGGGGFLLPFITLFYKHQGLSGAEIGLLSTGAGLAALIAAPIWGRHNDSAAAPRRWLQLELLASCACILILSQQSLPLAIAALVTVDALMNSGISPSSDVLSLTVLSRTRSGFGSIRLFASLGWAIAALIGGWLIEHIGLGVMFVGYVLGYGSGAGVIGLLRLPTPGTRSTDASQSRTSIVQAARRVWADRRLGRLAVVLAIFGFAMYGLRSFEALYLTQLGAGGTLVGLASTIGATIELPSMLWADRLVKRFGSARVLRASFFFEVVRLSVALIAPSVPMLLLMRAVGGVTFSWYVVAVLGFIYDVTPATQVTTTLALFNVTLPAFIRITAAPVSGVIFDQLGAPWLYLMGVIGSGVAWLIMQLRLTQPTVTVPELTSQEQSSEA